MYEKMLKAKGIEWIQLGHVFKFGDSTDKGIIISKIYYCKQIPFASVKDKESYKKNYNLRDLFWLPSIEDLLEIREYQNKAFMLHYVNEFITKLWDEESCLAEPETEWNIYMLAFIQHEMKQLKWDGEQWEEA